jgi:hypothetical protein
MWAEKSRERLEMRRSRPLNTVDWLGVLIDGVWLTRKICVVVAIGIDTAGIKQALDFEQGSPENIIVAAALIERPAMWRRKEGDCSLDGERPVMGRSGLPQDPSRRGSPPVGGRAGRGAT